MHIEDPVQMEKSIERWRICSFYVCPIAIAICSYIGIKEEMSHWAHRGEYVEYPYLDIRNKVLFTFTYRTIYKYNQQKFPWGDGNHTLFHNPQRNWVPGVGYEEDLEDH